MGRHHRVLALPLLERDQRHLMLGHERLDRRDKGLADRGHEDRRRKRLPAMLAEEHRHPAVVLQRGHVDVEVHPVDALDL
jgi:hypothetical protein